MYLNNFTTERHVASTETRLETAHCNWIVGAAYQSANHLPDFRTLQPCRIGRHTAHIRRQAASFPQRGVFQQTN